jgi:hypothetical protein
MLLKAAIDGPSARVAAGTVVKTVARGSSQPHKVQQPGLQVVESKGQSSRVFTGDPMCSRRFPAFTGRPLFSMTYVSMRYGLPVEAC